jgi:hypothetical protein
MAKSQRFLSGSRTKGSTATPSGSIIYSYQGINARTNASYFGSLLPRIGSGNRLKLYKDAKPLSENEFDDSLIINNDTADMRSISGSVITTRIGFELERMTYGQAPTSQKGEPYADISKFDPVSFLHDTGQTMWPANLWNMGSLPDHEFDGVIEVFDIRREILGQVDLRYEGHAPRGSVTGPFSESPFGSTAITDTWTFSDYAQTPFFDGPNEMSKDRGTDIPVLARMSFMAVSASWVDPNSAMAFPGYQGLEQEKLTPFIAEDSHKIIYSKIYNNNPYVTSPGAIYDLNSSWKVQGAPAEEYTYDANSSLVAWWRLSAPRADLTLPVKDYSATAAFTGSFPNSVTGPPTYSATSPGTGNYVQASSFYFKKVSVNAVAFTASGSINFNEILGGSPRLNADATAGAGTMKSFSIALWLRQEDDGGTLVSFGDPGAGIPALSPGKIYISVAADGKITFQRLSDDGSKGEQLDTAINEAPDNTWTHVVVTYDGSNYSDDGSTQEQALAKAYINGILVTPDFVTLAGIMRNANISDRGSLGARISMHYSSITQDFKGQLADVAVFSKVLAPTQIKAIYLASSGSITNKNTSHEDPMISALQLLNSSSCATLTSPIDHRANHGFYFGKKAGSITYGDW